MGPAFEFAGGLMGVGRVILLTVARVAAVATVLDTVDPGRVGGGGRRVRRG